MGVVGGEAYHQESFGTSELSHKTSIFRMIF
jgi:hypothetical protein